MNEYQDEDFYICNGYIKLLNNRYVTLANITVFYVSKYSDEYIFVVCGRIDFVEKFEIAKFDTEEQAQKALDRLIKVLV